MADKQDYYEVLGLSKGAGEAEIKNNTFDAPYKITTKCVGKVIDENNEVNV